MKKITGLLILSAILLAVPYGTGMLTEQRIEDLTVQYRLNPNVDHIDIDIQRGWFHSDVTSTITIHLAEFGEDTFELVFHHNVRHGPVLWGDERPLHIGFADVRTALKIPLETQEKFSGILKKTSPITLITELNYDGTQYSRLSLPEFRFDDDNTQITVHPLSLHGNLTLDQIEGDLNWQGAEINTVEKQFFLGQSTSQFNMQKESVVWTGDMNWDTDSIQLSEPETTLEINNIHVEAQTTVDHQKRVSSTQTLHVEHITYNHMNYGPGNYSILINHVPLTVLEKLDEVQTNLSALPASQRPYGMQSMGFSMLSVLPDLLTAEPEIELRDVMLKTPYGDIQASLRVTLLGLNEQNAMDLVKIKQQLRADIQLQFPAKFVTADHMNKMDGFIEKGWFIQKDTMIYTTLHMENGILAINDKAIPLPF